VSKPGRWLVKLQWKEHPPRALAMWMAGLTLAFAISIALAQKVRGYTGY